MTERNKAKQLSVDWSHCDTVLLDMDGTMLDLAFDHYFWRELVPARIALKRNISEADARTRLFALFAAKEGTLQWYCLEYWSQALDLDMVALKRSISHKVGFLPDTRRFLSAAKKSHRRLILVTNAHPEALRVKLSAVDFDHYFDGMVTSHEFGYPKEHEAFWPALQASLGFDRSRSLFVDDSFSVLRAARDYGINRVVAVERPDTGVPARRIEAFASVHSLDDLLGPKTTSAP